MRIGSLVVYNGPAETDRTTPHGVGIVELPVASMSAVPPPAVVRWFFRRRPDGTVEKNETLNQLPHGSVRAATPDDLARHLGECLPAALPDGSVLQVGDIGAASLMGKIMGAAMLAYDGEMLPSRVLAEPARVAHVFREVTEFAIDPSPDRVKESIFGGNPDPAGVMEALRGQIEAHGDPKPHLSAGPAAAPPLPGNAPMADAARMLQQLVAKAESPSTAALYIQYLSVLLARGGDGEFGGDDAVEKISARAEALARKARRVIDTLNLEESAGATL